MEITTYTLDVNDLTRQVNIAKEVLLMALVKDEILDQKQAETLCERYAIVLEKPGWFGKMFRKIEGAKPEEYYYRVVKVI